MTSWVDFAILFVAVSVMFAGIALFFAVADHDYSYEFDERRADPPPSESVVLYENLEPRHQEVFHEAREGGRFTFEEDRHAPPAVVRYEGNYYVFHRWRSIDWTDRGTLGSILVGAAGLGLAVYAIRRDVRSRDPAGR